MLIRNTTDHWRMLAFIGGVVVFAIVAVLFFLRSINPPESISNIVENKQIESDLAVVVDASDANREESVITSVNSEPSSIEEMLDLCGILYFLWSEQCINALDSYFMHQPVFAYMLELAEQPIWADVFANPEEDLRLTQEALRKGQCRLSDGEIQSATSIECHSNAVARTGALKAECSDILKRDSYLGINEHGYPLNPTSIQTTSGAQRSFANLQNEVDPMKAQRKRTKFAEYFLEKGWMRYQCETVRNVIRTNLEGIAIDTDRAWKMHKRQGGLVGNHGPPTPEELEADYASQGTLYQQFNAWLQREVGKELIRVAGRTGNEWALMQTLGNKSHMEKLSTMNPLLYHYRRILGYRENILGRPIDNLRRNWMYSISDRFDSIDTIASLAREQGLSVDLDQMRTFVQWDAEWIRRRSLQN